MSKGALTRTPLLYVVLIPYPTPALIYLKALPPLDPTMIS
jgi:hypothetical protein